MVKVIAWPDLPTVGYEFTFVSPVGRSRSGITGASYPSRTRPNRRVGALVVRGLGLDHAAGGTVEMLKREIDGTNLVRITTIPAHHHRFHGPLRGRVEALASTNGVDLVWTAGAVTLNWTYGQDLQATPFDDNGFQGLEVTGFQPGQIAAWPNELIELGGVQARVYRKAVADGAGVARLRVNALFATGGPIVIGAPESVVYELDDSPRTLRRLRQNFEIEFAFTEVLPGERGTFVEVDPWRD